MFHVGSWREVEWRPISDVQEKCQVTWGRKDGKIFDFDINQFLCSFSVPQLHPNFTFYHKGSRTLIEKGGLLAGRGETGGGGGRVWGYREGEEEQSKIKDISELSFGTESIKILIIKSNFHF